MNPIDAARWQMISIAVQLDAVMRHLIGNAENFDPRTMLFIGVAMNQIGRYATIFAVIADQPTIHHPLLAGQRCIFY